MQEVPDVESVAAMRELSTLLGRRVGPSTGTNFIGMLTLATDMRARGEQGSIVSLLCDSGERYAGTYHDAQWVLNTFGDCSEAQAKVRRMLEWS
jgi:cysteine synthase A